MKRNIFIFCLLHCKIRIRDESVDTALPYEKEGLLIGVVIRSKALSN